VADDTSDKRPDAGGDEAPTEPTEAATGPDTPSVDDVDAPREPEPVAAAAAPAAASSSGIHRSVGVPVWALGLVALLVIGLVGFGIGRWTAPDDTNDEVSGVFQGQVEDDGGDPQINPDVPDSTDRVILGVQVADSTDPEGAELVEVLAIGPAGEAGLEQGDVVTALDDDDVTNAEALAEAVQSHESGDEVTITYDRDGESDEVDVTLQSFSEIEPPGRQGGETDSSSDAA
jgi:S1-C subfamily serine protease